MDANTNKDIASFLCHSVIPIQQHDAPLKEGRKPVPTKAGEKTDYSKMRANKPAGRQAGKK